MTTRRKFHPPSKNNNKRLEFVYYSPKYIDIGRIRVQGWPLRIGDALIHQIPCLLYVFYFHQVLNVEPSSASRLAFESRKTAFLDGIIYYRKYYEIDYYRSILCSIFYSFYSILPFSGTIESLVSSSLTFQPLVPTPQLQIQIRETSPLWCFIGYAIYRFYMEIIRGVDVAEMYGVRVQTLYATWILCLLLS